jgi:hypothetical protein
VIAYRITRRENLHHKIYTIFHSYAQYLNRSIGMKRINQVSGSRKSFNIPNKIDPSFNHDNRFHALPIPTILMSFPPYILFTVFRPAAFENDSAQTLLYAVFA